MRHRFAASIASAIVATFGFLLVKPIAALASGYQVAAPIVHGNLAVYPVRGAGGAAPAPLTLDAALAQGQARIHELTGGRYAIENLSKRQLFIQAGDLIHGGSQDQVAAAGLLVPPGVHAMPATFYCVERHRSAPRNGQGTSEFAAAGLMSSQSGKMSLLSNAKDTSTRELLQRIGVWLSVESFTSTLSRQLDVSVRSPNSPSSLPLALENAALRRAYLPYVDALASPGGADVSGVVFAINGTIYGAELYASSELFQAIWPKLLRAVAIQALSLRGEPGTVLPAAGDAASYLAMADADSQSVLRAVTLQTDGAWVHKQYVTKIAASSELEATLFRALETGWTFAIPFVDIGTANPNRYREAVVIEALLKLVAEPGKAIEQARKAGLPVDPLQIARDGTASGQSGFWFFVLVTAAIIAWRARRRPGPASVLSTARQEHTPLRPSPTVVARVHEFDATRWLRMSRPTSVPSVPPQRQRERCLAPTAAHALATRRQLVDA
jgi:hypothetical protein